MTIEEAKKVGATHYKLNPSGEFIELYYRYVLSHFSDGTPTMSLCYFSSRNVWMGSGDNKRELLISRLIKI